MNNLTLLNGGVEIAVTYHDERPAEQVLVRQLPIRLMPAYGAAIQDEARAIELFCDRPPGWAESLTPESFSAVADAGQELNLPFFHAWFQRQLKRAEALQPGVIDEVQKNVSAAIQKAAAASTASSSTPPPAAG